MTDPRPFEQQTADAISNLTVACTILALALVVAMGLAAWGLGRATNASDAVKAGLSNQTDNRTANVAAWCGAIDALDGSLTGYVSSFGSHVRPLHLAPLKCAALEQKTLASTQAR